MQRSQLEDSDWRVRCNALKALGSLEPAALAQHAGAMVARLEDSQSNVREVALKALAKLEPAALAQHADAVVARLEDSVDGVRGEALSTLSKLEPMTLAQHAGGVVARLEDSHWQVRKMALETMAKLEQTTLAQHAGAVVARLKDSDWRVRVRALDVVNLDAKQRATASTRVYPPSPRRHPPPLRGVEADGPSHFVNSPRRPSGGTRLKAAQLTREGWELVRNSDTARAARGMRETWRHGII